MASSLKLGLRPAVIPSSLISLKDALPSGAALRAPSEIHWGREIATWGMMGNSTYGDCAFASSFHLIMLMTGLANRMIVGSDEEVLAGYSAVTGFNPDDPSTDQGAILSEVLAYWQQHGFVAERQTHRLAAFTNIDPRDLSALKFAVAHLAGVDTGVKMTQTAMQEFLAGKPWSDTSDQNIEGGHCLSGDTKIPLLNGQETAIADLPLEKDIWVYSCRQDGQLVPGRARSLGKTGISREVLRIALDNGEIIRATTNHLFLLRSGEYKEARFLVNGESLMPLYREIINSGEYGGYEKCLNPKSERWIPTHRLIVAAHTHLCRGNVIHHKDFNKRNNEPHNLVQMSWEDHTNLHSTQTVCLAEYAKSEAGRQKSRELMTALWADPEWRERRIAQNAINGHITMQKLLATGWRPGQSDPEAAHARGVALQEKFPSRTNGATTPEAVAKRMEKIRHRLETDSEFAARKTEIARANIAKANLWWAERKESVNSSTPNNHKIVSIENGGVTDVYDIHVQEWHNFALSSGIFVHNSIPIVGYSNVGPEFVTWGKVQQATWDWWLSYNMEIYGLLDRDLVGALNLNWAALESSMQALAGG